jgi:hypothetical protein
MASSAVVGELAHLPQNSVRLSTSALQAGHVGEVVPLLDELVARVDRLTEGDAPARGSPCAAGEGIATRTRQAAVK